MCLCTKNSQRPCSLGSEHLDKHPLTRIRCTLYVLLLITTDGPALFVSTSLCHISFCHCLYYHIPDLNIPQGITGHEPLSSQLHYEEFQHLHSPNIMWSKRCVTFPVTEVQCSRSVFLNRQALASIIPGCERFGNCHFSFLSNFHE